MEHFCNKYEISCCHNNTLCSIFPNWFLFSEPENKQGRNVQFKRFYQELFTVDTDLGQVADFAYGYLLTVKRNSF